MPARALAFALASTVLFQTPAAAPSARFPSVTADSLSKTQMHLPGDFAGSGANLVLVAFEREQQKDLDTWVPSATKLENSLPPFRFYELPILPRRDILYRWWLNTAMRSGMPDDSARARTVPLYVDKESFRNSLKIPTEKTMTALLLDKKGDVIWRAEGPWSEDKQKTLTTALERR